MYWIMCAVKEMNLAVPFTKIPKSSGFAAVFVDCVDDDTHSFSSLSLFSLSLNEYLLALRSILYNTSNCCLLLLFQGLLFFQDVWQICKLFGVV